MRGLLLKFSLAMIVLSTFECAALIKSSNYFNSLTFTNSSVLLGVTKDNRHTVIKDFISAGFILYFSIFAKASWFRSKSGYSCFLGFVISSNFYFISTFWLVPSFLEKSSNVAKPTPFLSKAIVSHLIIVPLYSGELVITSFILNLELGAKRISASFGYTLHLLNGAAANLINFIKYFNLFRYD